MTSYDKLKKKKNKYTKYIDYFIEYEFIILI